MTIWTAEDRRLAVPSDATVKTSRIDLHRVRFANRSRMALGDLADPYHRLLCLDGRDPWPCPVGRWNGGTFDLHDGRHEYVAALMLGRESLLMGWIADG